MNKKEKLESTLEATARMLCVEIDVSLLETIWYFHDKCHRDHNKPAIIFANGNKCWYQYDKLHRDRNKPAIIFADGSKYWYQHGKKIK